MTQSMLVVREKHIRVIFKKHHSFKKLRKMVLKFVGTSFDPKIKQQHPGECCYDRGFCYYCKQTFYDEQFKEAESLEGQEYFALEACAQRLFTKPERVAEHFDGELGKAMGAFYGLSEADRKKWIGIAKQSILAEEAEAKAEGRLPGWESKLEEKKMEAKRRAEKKMEANRGAVTRKRKPSLMSSLDIEIDYMETFCKGAEAMKKFAESKKDAEKGASSSKQTEKGASSSNNAEK